MTKKSFSWNRVTVGLGAFLAGAVVTVSAESPVTTARLVPDWELGQSVTLVWPEHVPGQRGAVGSYVELIRSLPTSAEVALVSSDPPRVRWLQEMGREVRYLALPGIRDLRVGDWGPLPAAHPNGRLFGAQFSPPALNAEERGRVRARDVARWSAALSGLIYGDGELIDLALSAPHLVHNGRDIALLSNRVIAENEQLSLQAIRERLKSSFGLEHVIFLPAPAGDATGGIHAGVRFVAPDQLLLADIPDDPWSQQAREVLEGTLPDDVQVHAVPLASGSIAEDQGNYLRFVQVGNQIWLPAFDIPSDESVLITLREVLPDHEFLPIPLPALDYPLNRLIKVY